MGEMTKSFSNWFVIPMSFFYTNAECSITIFLWHFFKHILLHLDEINGLRQWEKRWNAGRPHEGEILIFKGQV